MGQEAISSIFWYVPPATVQSVTRGAGYQIDLLGSAESHAGYCAGNRDRFLPSATDIFDVLHD